MKNMSRFCLFFLVLSSFFFWGCNKELPPNEYLVKGKIDNLSEDMKLIVSDISTKDIVPLYEIAVRRNDKFKLKGNLEQPTPFYLTLLRESDSTFSPSDNLVIFFEPTRMEIQGEAGKLSEAKITGSRSHNHFEMYRNGIKNFENNMKKYSVEAMQSSQSDDTIAYRKAMLNYEESYEQWKKHNKQFISQDSISYAVRSFLAANYMLEEEYVAELETLIKGKKSTWTKQIQSFLKQVKLISLGQPTPNLTTLQDIEGAAKSIAALDKKPTILYFWASFQPQAVTQVEQFSVLEDTSYQFVGISLDTDAVAWKESIENLPKEHLQLIDVSPDRQAAIAYHLTDLPLFIVLDENHKMIHKTNSIEKLNAFLIK